MEKHLVSIIIPIYNMEEYLEPCLLSIVGQTYRNFEVLLVDDGSVDKTAQICHKFVELDKRFHYIYQENAGVSVARNTGQQEAKGEFITFVDPDDTIKPQLIEKLLELFNQECVDVALAGFVREGSYGDVIYEKQNHFHNEIIEPSRAIEECYDYHMWFLSVWAKMFRRSLICDGAEGTVLNDTDIRRGEDSLWLMRALVKANKIACTDYVGYIYRIRQGSVCGQEIIDRMNWVVPKYYPDLAECYRRNYRFLQEKEYSQYGLFAKSAMDYGWEMLVIRYYQSGMDRKLYKQVYKDYCIWKEYVRESRQYEKYKRFILSRNIMFGAMRMRVPRSYIKKHYNKMFQVKTL